jgi:hypothetical protein
MPYYQAETVKQQFKSSYPTWGKNEIMMCYIVARNCFSFYNKTNSLDQMKSWRKLAKDGKIKIAEYNNKTKKINGVEHYTLVVQEYADGEFSEANCLDPMGMFILGEMVSGYVYLFKSKENRDKTFEYVMKGVSQPIPNPEYDGEDIVGLFGNPVNEGDELENIVV